MRITKYKTLMNEDKLIYLVKESSVNYATMDNLGNPENVYHMLCDVFLHNKQTEEYLYLICTNSKNKPVGVFEVSHGAINGTISNAREIFQKALMCNAAGIILAHNHPSGNATPSNEDIQTYKSIKEASKIMMIPLVDSIIVGDCQYYSFRESYE